MKRFYSGCDQQFIGLVAAIVLLPCLLLPLLFPQLFVWMLLADAGIVAYALSVYFRVWYRFTNEGLELCMLQRRNLIPYAHIRGFAKTETGGRPCLGFSRKRIKLSLRGGDHLYISPIKREEVWGLLQTHCGS